jgi:hypothetical protein
MFEVVSLNGGVIHKSNLREEMLASCPLVSQTIELMMLVFQSVAGRGWKLQKVNGLT